MQNGIEDHADEVCDFLVVRNFTVYMCGPAKIERDVAKRVGTGLKRTRVRDDGRLRDWQEQGKRAHWWQEDIWAWVLGFWRFFFLPGIFQAAPEHAPTRSGHQLITQIESRDTLYVLH